MSLLMLFSAFTSSRPATLLETDNSSSDGSREGSSRDLSGSTLADDTDGKTLMSSDSDSKARTGRPKTICYGDIDLFLLRNPDNPERDILVAEVDFRNLKGRPVGADGLVSFYPSMTNRFPNMTFIGLNSLCTRIISLPIVR
jgi:hypothetical protein